MQKFLCIFFYFSNDNRIFHKILVVPFLRNVKYDMSKDFVLHNIFMKIRIRVDESGFCM